MLAPAAPNAVGRGRATVTLDQRFAHHRQLGGRMRPSTVASMVYKNALLVYGIQAFLLNS
jgi:hypothetical protein